MRIRTHLLRKLPNFWKNLTLLFYGFIQTPLAETCVRNLVVSWVSARNKCFAAMDLMKCLPLVFKRFSNLGEDAAPLRVPEISYSFYPVYADLYSISLEKIPLNRDFSIPVEPFCKAGGGVAIANPNAPTSLAMEISDIRRILIANPERVVLIDEAYSAFGDESCISLLSEFPNLLVVGTLSKSHSLAGLRLGYAIGSEELIAGLSRIRDSFNSYPVDAIAQKIAAIAVHDTAWYEKNTNHIIATREKTKIALIYQGFTVLNSKANFLFAKPNTIPAAELYKKLREAGILVRYFDKDGIRDYLRISIGTDEEMIIFLSEASAIIRQRNEEII